MRDRNGKDIAVGQRAVVLVGVWSKGKVGTVSELAMETELVHVGEGEWSTWVSPDEIAVVDDAAGEAGR